MSSVIREECEESPWNVKVSGFAEKCHNSCRDDMSSWTPNDGKEVISLAEYTSKNSYIKTPEEVTNSVLRAIEEGKCNGYAPSIGYEDARQAVANFFQNDGIEVNPNNIILSCGGSSCIEMCITVLADKNKNHNILVPKPGPPLYSTIAASLDVEVRHYDLLPSHDWSADLFDLTSKLDANTAAVVINNPSDPSGTVCTAPQLRQLLDVCRRRRVPVIADESFAYVTFDKFESSIGQGINVPILLCGGLSHTFLVPGWRVGWIVVHDPVGALENIKKGLISLSQRIIGCSTFVQGSMEGIVEGTTPNRRIELMETLLKNVKHIFERIENIPGLKPHMPQGTTHMIVEVNLERFDLGSSLEFARCLYEEESVMVVPGELYGISGYFKLVTNISEDIVNEAIDRMKVFCARHYKN